jgi:transcriptional regulator with XRE-family HTH domain
MYQKVSTMSIPKASHSARAGLVIRMLRALLGMDQQLLADNSGVSRATIMRLENMKNVDAIKSPTVTSVMQTFEEVGISFHLEDDDLVLIIPRQIIDLSAAKHGYEPVVDDKPPKTQAERIANLISIIDVKKVK